jgi:hypothetical protein
LNVYCSPTDLAPTEKPNGVIPELERMTPKTPKTPKHKSRADRGLFLDLEADTEADADAIVTPKKVNKGKAKAVDLPEDPAPKVCYNFIAQ